MEIRLGTYTPANDYVQPDIEVYSAERSLVYGTVILHARTGHGKDIVLRQKGDAWESNTGVLYAPVKDKE